MENPFGVYGAASWRYQRAILDFIVGVRASKA